ncbi:MAG: hypothetical protein K9L21_01970 [Spirochaetia bacterium]|nr:hypothetical protein [Spirochaetia bacterium]
MKLLFHIGQQKAGSTALQNALKTNKALLEEKGFTYPLPQRKCANQGALSSLIFEKERWPRQIVYKDKRKPDENEKRVSKILSNIQKASLSKKYHTVILSSEYFFRKLNDYNSEQLEKYLFPYFSEIQFVCYIRHPAARYLSGCLQKLHHSGRIPQPSKETFRSVIASYSSFADITVRPYIEESGRSFDIIRDFFQTFIPEISVTDIMYGEKSNEAVPAEVASILQKFRKSIHPFEDDIIFPEDYYLLKKLTEIAKEKGLLSKAKLNQEVEEYIYKKNVKELEWLQATCNITFQQPYPDSIQEPDAMQEFEELPQIEWLREICNVDEEVENTLLMQLVQDNASYFLKNDVLQKNEPSTFRNTLFSQAKRIMKKLFSVYYQNDRMKIYLHAGTHKTGTTAIQFFAAKHRKALLKKGLVYPKAAPILYRMKQIHAHHWFAHAIAEKNRLQISEKKLKSFAKKWIKTAIQHDANLFISIEALYRHKLGTGSYQEKRKRYLERVSSLFGNAKVIAVLAFRRPDDYLSSYYQNSVIYSYKCLPDFMHFYDEKIPKGLEYYDNASLFQEVFDSITCLVYEDLASSNKFFTHFFAAMDIDVSSLKDVGIWKKGYNVPEIQVKNFANNYISSKKENRRFLSWMRKPQITKTISESYQNSAYSLWPSHEVRRQFLESRENDLKNLQETFFPGRSALFPALRESDTLPPVPPLPDNLKKMIFDYFGRTS